MHLVFIRPVIIKQALEFVYQIHTSNACFVQCQLTYIEFSRYPKDSSFAVLESIQARGRGDLAVCVQVDSLFICTPYFSLLFAWRGFGLFKLCMLACWPFWPVDQPLSIYWKISVLLLYMQLHQVWQRNITVKVIDFLNWFNIYVVFSVWRLWATEDHGQVEAVVGTI